MEWGTFVYQVMPYGLCNAPTTFYCVMMATFQDFLQLWWRELFLDDFAIYRDEDDMADKLALAFKCFLDMGISLNLEKCPSDMDQEILLGYEVSKNDYG